MPDHEEIERIAKKVRGASILWMSTWLTPAEAATLLAEVERLRAVTEAGRLAVLYTADRNARAMEIVEAVADVELQHSAYSGYYRCPFPRCSVERREEPPYDMSTAAWRNDWLTHTPDCPVTKARALLARDEGAGEDEGSAEG